ncbi:DUF6615 family protein [Kitasatospora hibisci]|uniref:DUF6615 family protein n=1 Tax=Kitasatospora hibisci TaxID=3369522 RepID=UPI003754E43D
MWREESATDVLCWRAAPHLRPVTFNRRQEGHVGADWLWWFVDADTGRAFGMLCQAKNLKRSAGGWSIGYGQSNSQGSQLTALLRSAGSLDLPAVYVLYCGPPSHRRDLSCGPSHTAPQCPRCARAGVSVLSALAAEYLHSYGDADRAATDSYRTCVPLEDLTVSGRCGPLLDPWFGVCPPTVRRFLTQPQYGSAEVAKQLLRQLLSFSRGYLFDEGQKLQSLPPDAVFPAVPQVAGHFSESVTSHVLRGLRREAPNYVWAALEGLNLTTRDLPTEVSEGAAGLIVTRLRNADPSG